jgi:hypothetical protein
LVVRVDSRRVDTDVPPRLALSWNWGGILGKVYLRRVGPLDIESAQVIPRLHNRNQRARSRMFELHDIQLLIDDLHRVVITLRRR